MKPTLRLLCPLLFAFLVACDSTQKLAASTPEAQGVASASVLAFVEAAEKEIDSLHSFVLLRHGKIVAQGSWSPYHESDPHMLYSLSKSFCSTAIGFAVDEGRLGVNDPVLSFFPEDAPPNPSENLKAMRLHDLLSMNTGHGKDTLPFLTGGKDPNWPKVFLAQPVEHKPGTHFLYNTGATYMCSAILQKVTGQTLLEYLTPRLFKPLGIKNPTWETDPRGVNVGGWGLKVNTLDIAKFGQLYLQKGVWNGKRLLSESWVAAATSTQTPNGNNPQSDWNQGYGYQFWRSRHNAYRGDGALGQFCLVMPDQDAVLAITAGNSDMQATLNLVWKHLLPEMNPSALPVDPKGQGALNSKLASLARPMVAGEALSPLAAKISGKRFLLEPNSEGLESVVFHHDVTIQSKTGEQEFTAIMGFWVMQDIPFYKLGLAVVPVSRRERTFVTGAWTAPNRFVLHAYIVETPYRLEMEFTFDADGSKLTLKRRVHPMQPQWTEIKGAIQ